MLSIDQVGIVLTGVTAVFLSQSRHDPCYGYKWGAWSETAACSIDGKRNEGARNWRLPA